MLKAELEPWPRTAESKAESADVKESPLPHHVAGLSYTATGYGARIPTPYMVKVGARWRRVYMAQYGNAGTAYIGRPGAWEATVDVWHE